ncbi:methyl-accepting chemotaxis protein [Enterobacter hormaechei]|uniref:Methyl-accepting chemotaxis protein n=1 Tax=Phytobacter ursingii TaxID=1972431 RepID=A0AB35RQA9_9ENTR|nr:MULTISPECIES: methyl-accepting chemotaxis protein [Enterobacteriaceae]MDV2863594.1 methyl-accepting chemotaxis protein [Phytobacter ursingii]GJL34065.1 methyl-accepting chemotaxis protein [Enterobacter hormaechei]
MSFSQGLKNITISKKLSVGFGIVLFLVAIATVLSVLRFKEIRDVYAKTNLIYSVNIEVFQAKINRLKYLYGDDKAGPIMSDYVKHASQLTASASELSWNDEESALLHTLAGHLANFEAGSAEMQQATNAMKSVRDAMDKMGSDEQRARFTALISTPVADNALTAQIFDQLIAIGGVRDAALMVRFSPTKETRVILDDRFNKAQAAAQTLTGQLPAELVSPLQALWGETTRYRDLSINYFTAVQAIKTAEDKVKIAGDDSSADIKKLIASVKTYNDALADNSSTTASIIGIIAILIGVIVSWWIIRQITRPVVHNLALAERIASGDLSSQITAQSDDELGKLTAAMGRMNSRLREMIFDVRNSVAQVSRAATEIAEGNTDLSSRTEQQAAAVVQTAASMEELTATVKNNADNARNASRLAAQASNTASEGGNVMRDVVKTMNDIHNSSNKIADITAVINSIAFQTNILALNAAVEAARAGEQGRGFAVVASEVRSLSQRSSQAAKDIEQLITESVSRINTGSELVAKAGETMGQVVQSVTRVNDIMGEISSASEEQSRGIEQIARAVGELDSTTQQNAALVSESSTAAGSLEEQALHLEQLVATFRLESGVAPVKSSAPARPQPPVSAPRQPAEVTSDDGWTTF